MDKRPDANRGAAEASKEVGTVKPAPTPSGASKQEPLDIDHASETIGLPPHWREAFSLLRLRILSGVRREQVRHKARGHYDPEHQQRREQHRADWRLMLDLEREAAWRQK